MRGVGDGRSCRAYRDWRNPASRKSAGDCLGCTQCSAHNEGHSEFNKQNCCARAMRSREANSVRILAYFTYIFVQYGIRPDCDQHVFVCICTYIDTYIDVLYVQWCTYLHIRILATRNRYNTYKLENTYLYPLFSSVEHLYTLFSSVVTAKHHGQVSVLDLDMSLHCRRVMARTGATIRVHFRPYRKPGNAYACIPFTSFHGHHTFRGWVLGTAGGAAQASDSQ